MNQPLTLHPDRLFPSNDIIRNIARRLYKQVKDLPIVSPHGHTDPAWFADNQPFPDATNLLIKPDHYVYRLLYSQGIPLEDLGISDPVEQKSEAKSRAIWHLFASHYYLFRGTPTKMWMDYVFSKVFGLTQSLNASTADHYFDCINEQLAQPEFLPRALFERFNIEVIATTESPLDDLRHHQSISDSNWSGKVVTAYRPDPVVDPDFEGFHDNLQQFGKLSHCDINSYQQYLQAHRQRRAFFKTLGATSTDHGHPSAATANLSQQEAEQLYKKLLSNHYNAKDAELFRAQMLTEFAGMSIEDGLVMQIHPGSLRNHNEFVFKNFGRDKGADIPTPTNYVHALKPLLEKHGNNANLNIILFTLDETVYSRELAPLAGHYPCLKLGPAWWFHDSPEGMRRFRQQTTETAGYYNTVGFNDDTRAFLSIPARHDVARRMDCSHLAELVADHRLNEDEAAEIAVDLAYNLVKKAYKL